MSDATPAKAPPNVWTLSSDRNPYVHNVFALLSLDPDEGESTLLSRCRRLSKQLEFGERPAVFGHPIAESDVARAHFLAAHAEDFVAERLLAHTVHTVDPKDFAQPIAALRAIPWEPPEALLPLPIRDVSFLTQLLPALPELPAELPAPVSPALLRQVVQPRTADEEVYDL